MYTIKDLSEGKCAVINDGTLEELNLVLKMAFKDARASSGSFIFYSKSSSFSGDWGARKDLSLPTQSVKDFLAIPEKWYVRVTDENRQILSGWGGKIAQDYYESITSNKQYLFKDQLHHYQEIPFKLFELKILNKQMDYAITAEEMKELYYSIDKSCEWSKQVFGWYGKNMLDGIDCNVTQYILDQAKKDANSTQLNLINRIFKPKFKVGDWIICPDAENPEASQIITTDGLYYRTTENLHNSNLLGFSKNDNLRLATPEEIERSQIKDGDLVWVKDKAHANWTIRKAKSSFSEEGIRTYDMLGLTQTWQQYKKASQVVVDEYKRLQ